MIMIYFPSSISSVVSVTVSEASYLFEIFGLLTPFVAPRVLTGCLSQAGGSGADGNPFLGVSCLWRMPSSGLRPTFHIRPHFP